MEEPVPFRPTSTFYGSSSRALGFPAELPVHDGHAAASCEFPLVQHAHVWSGGVWTCLGTDSRAYTSSMTRGGAHASRGKR
jgi:hypothetical protein